MDDQALEGFKMMYEYEGIVPPKRPAALYTKASNRTRNLDREKLLWLTGVVKSQRSWVSSVEIQIDLLQQFW